TGEKVEIFYADRPGRIVGIRLKPSESLRGKKRNIVLKAFWDDDPEPAINCPVGDFFGYAWGEPAMKSLLVGTNEKNENYCYWPMPFERSGRIELHADESLNEPISIQAEVFFSPIGQKENEGKFYTIWRRENPTTKGSPFTFIDTKGLGHIVGVVQQSQGMETGNTYYFEGDDQTTIDGELVIHGTGSEDFYNGGWYDVPGRWETRVSRPLSGCLDYKKHLGRTGGYRIMLGDAYAFNESILQTIEHAPERNELLNDYVGVTYLYSKDRPTCDLMLLPVEKRMVTDPTRIIFAVWWNVPIYSSSINNAVIEKRISGVKDENGRDIRVLSMRGKDQDYFGPHSISFTCELPASGYYDVSLDVVKGHEQGKVQIFRDEAAIGNEVDLYNIEDLIARGISMGRFHFNEGPNQVMFKIVGKNENSRGLGFDLTNIIFDFAK
ncbi:glycoside hydrolase family 172 protein, partial [Bacteroidota bacterium]